MMQKRSPNTFRRGRAPSPIFPYLERHLLVVCCLKKKKTAAVKGFSPAPINFLKWIAYLAPQTMPQRKLKQILHAQHRP